MCTKEFHSDRMRLSIQDKVRALPYFREGKIIEIGCGAGDFLHILKERFPNSAVVGIDKDRDLLDLAKKRYRNIEFILQDITRWPIDDDLKGSFDTVILSSTLYETLYDIVYDLSLCDK